MNAKFLKNWGFFLVALLFSAAVLAKNAVPLDTVDIHALPAEAQRTLGLIKQGGPFPYAKDGRVFSNREGVLPKQKRGYYHEFTVPTPGARNRGARRIVSGGEPASYAEYFYTDDHYATFRRIKE